MAKQLFKERWLRQWRQFAKYLRYVFNDHAILALVFILGAGLVSYQNFLSTLAVTRTNQILIVVIVLATALLWRTPGTFIKEEDPIYLMGNESVLHDIRRMGLVYSLLIRLLIEVMVLILLFPVIFRLFSEQSGVMWTLIIITILLALVVMLVTWRNVERFPKHIQSDNLLNWSGIAKLESTRVQRILHVFGWFVDIPEQKVTIKTYVWSDWLIKHWPKAQGQTALYVTTFLRTNDFVQLWLTIVVLGSVLIMTLSGWLLLGMLMSLMYVLLIQILPIMFAYRQRVFDYLVPLTIKQRKQSFHQFILPLFSIMLFLWLVVGLLVQPDVKMIVMIEFSLVLWGLALVFLYSDRKAENKFKRR